jgi:hypothetical protein
MSGLLERSLRHKWSSSRLLLCEVPGYVHGRDHVLGAEPAEPVPVLDQDGGHASLPQQGEQLVAMAVRCRVNFACHLVDAVAVLVAQATIRAILRSRSACSSAEETWA